MTRGCATLRIDVHNTLVLVPGRGPALAYPAPAADRAVLSPTWIRKSASAMPVNGTRPNAFRGIRAHKLAGRQPRPSRLASRCREIRARAAG